MVIFADERNGHICDGASMIILGQGQVMKLRC